MNRVLFAFLWRRHRLGLLLCGLGPVLLGAIIGLIYPTLASQREAAKVFLRFASRFFDGEQVDLFSPTGAFALPLQHPLTLTLYAVAPAIAALALPAGERGRGALDLLLATPLERGRLMTTLGAFTLAVSTWLACAGFTGAFLGAAIAGEGAELPMARFLVVGIIAGALVAAFGALALLISVLSRDRGQATLCFGVTVFLLLLVDVGARLWPAGAFLRWFTPYGYLRPAEILGESSRLAQAPVRVGALLLLATALFVVAYRVETRRARV